MADTRLGARLYRRWMAFAEGMQRVVVTLLFGTIYIMIVPWFALAAWAMGLGRRNASSTWVRKKTERDDRFFDRMG